MLTTYPNHPGFKVVGPSKQAAEKVEPKSKIIRDKIVEILKQHHRIGLTADELAFLLDASVLSVRPRVTELLRMNILEDSGGRRKNEMGSTVTVWRLK